jgi:hypothetical protein
MAGLGAAPRAPALLDHLPAVHDGHLLADLGHHRQVVGDEHQADPGLAAQRASSRRIWSWIVTSSAVVGSSHRMSSGSQDSAIAIITRCRMPPENSCG